MSEMRSYEQLRVEEKKQVETQLASLDYLNQISIIQFGVEISKEVGTISTQIISRLNENDFNGTKTIFNNIVQDLKMLNLNEMFEKNNVAKLPISRRKQEKKITESLFKHMLIEREIDRLQNQFLEAKIAFTEDMCFCSRMIQKMFEYAKKQEIDYITLEEAIKRMKEEKAKIQELYNQYPSNIEYSYKIAELDRTIERLEVKAQDFFMFRESTMRSVKELNFVQRASEIMVLKIQDAMCNVSTFWKKSFCIASGVYRLNNSTVIDRIIKDETKKLLQQHNKILLNTILKATTEEEIKEVNAKTLHKAKKELEKAVNDFTSVSKEMKKVRAEAIKAVEDIYKLSLQLQTATSIKQLEDKNE